MVKKGKKIVEVQKTEQEIFLEELTAIVEKKLWQEKWYDEDEEIRMKKKLTKKDKARIAQRRAEELRQAVELERIRIIEEEKKKQEEERLAAIEKEQRDSLEQGIRVDQLKVSCGQIRKLQHHWLKNERKDINQQEWEQYLKCDGLPDPSNCGEMNTYLHLWDKVRENTLEEMAIRKTDEVLKLLDTLDNFLDCPAVSESKKQDWLTIRNNFREYQQYNLDCLAYRLLRDISVNLDRLDIPTARKFIKHPLGTFILCVWALVQLPIPAENPKRAPPKPTHLTFPELCDLDVEFPKAIKVWARCVRVMFVTYDHFSHRCDSYGAPQVPPGLSVNLAEITSEEWNQKAKAILSERERIRKELERDSLRAWIVAQATEKDEDKETALALDRKKKEYVKVDTSAIYLSLEDAQYAEYRTLLTTEVPENVINLRKYRILGGIFFLDLFFQPPQPSSMVLSEITLSTLSLPKFLEAVPFHYLFKPPPPAEPGVVRQPEEIEAEIKRVEAEYEELLHVSLQLPSSVLWLDPPTVCQWDEESSSWGNKDVHDVKHNEEKQTVQFKIGRFGAFAMAVYRYNNMPYQAWELKPISGNKVTLTIMAAVLIIEFTVSGSLISLTQLQNAPSDALDYLLGQWLTLPRLRRRLRKGGVDVFPAHDAFLYLEGSCEKHTSMEKHLYFQMAMCSIYFNFAWSRWNLLAGRRHIVMQMRENGAQERMKQPNYSMLMVTPLKALLVDCTEVSQTFNEEGIKKMKFYSDLYHLILGISTVSMKCKLEKTPIDLINSVAQLLIATRVLSLS